MLGLLHDLYPKTFRFSTCVYPSADADVVTAPYNTILATKELIEHADCVFPLDNSAMFLFAKSEAELLAKHDKKLAASTPNVHDQKDRGFNAINAVAARMLCHLTSSSRFMGQMNVDLNEIYTNLVPFPRLHFLITSLSWRHAHSKARVTTGTRVTAGSSAIKGNLQRSFTEILTSRGQLTAACPTGSDGYLPGGEGPDVSAGFRVMGKPLTLASAFLTRGHDVALSDLLSCVTAAQRNHLRFPSWNEDACKVIDSDNSSQRCY